MPEPRSEEEIREATVRTLQEISSWLMSDPEIVESLSPQELHEEMAEAGLDSNRRPPVLPGRINEAPTIEPKLRLGSEKIALDTTGTEYSRKQLHTRKRRRFGELGYVSTGRLDRARLWIHHSPDGEITRSPIGALLGNAQFQKRLNSFCRNYEFRMFAGSYNAEDLYQDTCLKVFKYRRHVVASGNILEDQDFWGWLFVVTRNQYLSRVRQHRKCRNSGWSRCDQSVEELDMAATEQDHEGQHLLSRFLDFIKGYSNQRQRTIRLWLQGYSYREIAAKSEQSVRCSHVSVGRWIKSAIEDFRRTLEAYETEPARSRALAARLFQRQDEDEAM